MVTLTIDTGTTNTRVCLWENDQLISFSGEMVGVRDTSITGSPDTLQKGIKKVIETTLAKAGKVKSDIGIILASGMITSNYGIYEVPHVTAPVNIEELAGQMVSKVIPEVIDGIPIWFVPGVKNHVEDIDLDNCEQMDIMRGEEVETFGLLEKIQVKGPAILIHQGSHTKFIRLDSKNSIIGSTTTMSGELIAAITNNTILAGSVRNPSASEFVNEIDQKWLEKGSDYVKEVGINRVCFVVRLIDLFLDATINQKANFLLGAITELDICALKNSKALRATKDAKIILTGKENSCCAYEILLKKDAYFQGDIIKIGSEIIKNISGYGAICVAKKRGLLY